MDDASNVLLRAGGGGPPQGFSRWALASFVCAALSIGGLVLGPFAQPLVYLVLLCLPAIVGGHLARRQFRKFPGAFRNESMATFGLSVGYLALFLNAFVLAAMLLLASR